MRFHALVIIAALAGGCIEQSDAENSGVRETGYLSCTVTMACDGGLQCVTAAGATACVEPPAEGSAACQAGSCECWASQVCTVGAQCVQRDDGFDCIAPEAPTERVQAGIEASSLSFCPMPGDAQRFELSLVLLDDAGEAVTGQSVVAGLGAPLEAALQTGESSFVPPSGGLAGGAVAAAVSGDADMSVPLTPEIEGVRFEARPDAGADQLVVLALDHSGSLIGTDPISGEVDRDRATDIRDERIYFFRALIQALGPDVFFSLVHFQGELPVIDPEFASPTRNRDTINRGLTNLESGSTGGTPLAQTLLDIRTTIIESNQDLKSSVVLFTDGLETGDVTDTADRSELKGLIEQYASDEIAVHVLQLRPPVDSGYSQARDPLLVDLACRTGGSYRFLESPQEFLDPRLRLSEWLAARTAGHWRMEVRLDGADALAPGDWLISTGLLLASGRLGVPVDFDLSADPQRDFDDRRLWLRKE